jgi:hypothetical protein
MTPARHLLPPDESAKPMKKKVNDFERAWCRTKVKSRVGV